MHTKCVTTAYLHSFICTHIFKNYHQTKTHKWSMNLSFHFCLNSSELQQNFSDNGNMTSVGWVWCRIIVCTRRWMRYSIDIRAIDGCVFFHIMQRMEILHTRRVSECKYYWLQSCVWCSVNTLKCSMCLSYKYFYLLKCYSIGLTVPCSLDIFELLCVCLNWKYIFCIIVPVTVTVVRRQIRFNIKGIDMETDFLA